MKLSQTGFTLIEKLIVLLTIVLLVAIAVPVYLSARNKRTEIQCRTNLHAIGAWYLLEQPRPSAAEIRFFIREQKISCPRGVYNVPDHQTYLIGDFRDNEDILVWCPNHPHHSVQMFKGRWGVIELNKKQLPLFLSLTREGKVGYYPILIPKEVDQR